MPHKRKRAKLPDLSALRPEQIEFATADKIDAHPEVLADFLKRVLGFKMSECALSDESMLWDFCWTKRMVAKTKRLYGVELPPKAEHLYVWQVIAMIVQAKNAQSSKVH